jgi:hypothetical protein
MSSVHCDWGEGQSESGSGGCRRPKVGVEHTGGGVSSLILDLSINGDPVFYRLPRFIGPKDPDGFMVQNLHCAFHNPVCGALDGQHSQEERMVDRFIQSDPEWIPGPGAGRLDHPLVRSGLVVIHWASEEDFAVGLEQWDTSGIFNTGGNEQSVASARMEDRSLHLVQVDTGLDTTGVNPEGEEGGIVRPQFLAPPWVVNSVSVRINDLDLVENSPGFTHGTGEMQIELQVVGGKSFPGRVNPGDHRRGL